MLQHITHREMEDELVSDGCDDRFIWERKDLGKPLRLCRVPDVDGWGRQVPKETSSVRKRPAMWQNTPAMWQKRQKCHIVRSLLPHSSQKCCHACHVIYGTRDPCTTAEHGRRDLRNVLYLWEQVEARYQYVDVENGEVLNPKP